MLLKTGSGDTMPCESRRRNGQSLAVRQAAIKKAIAALDARLKKRLAKVTVGPQGAIVFTGWDERDDITDACAYRLLAVNGSALALAAIAQAEAVAGRSVNRQALTQGVHSHDGGQSWHGRG